MPTKPAAPMATLTITDILKILSPDECNVIYKTMTKVLVLGLMVGMLVSSFAVMARF